MPVGYDSGVALLKGMRRFPIRGFENYLLFYLPSRDGIDIVRVLPELATYTASSRRYERMQPTFGRARHRVLTLGNGDLPGPGLIINAIDTRIFRSHNATRKRKESIEESTRNRPDGRAGRG